MNQKGLSNWLKMIIIGMAICGAFIYFYILPYWGKEIISFNPDITYSYWPFLIMFWTSGIGCYLVLFYAWKISTQIARDNSFSYENATYLKRISIIVVADCIYFFTFNIVLLMLQINYSDVILISFMIVFIGLAMAVVTAVLSHLVQKAAEIKAENELTI